MKAHSISLKTIALFLVTALIAAGCQPALAEEVTVKPDEPFVSMGGPTTAELTATADPAQTAMLYVVPSAPRDEVLGPVSAGTSPLTLQVASGADARLGVDLSAANKATEGWPWYGKAAVVVGCVLVVGLATWGIVEASHKGSHDHDSSTHYTIYGDDGSTLNVRIGADNNTSSSSTTTGW